MLTTDPTIDHYFPATRPAIHRLINAHIAGWPYSRPLDDAALDHWETLGDVFQPAWMLLAERDGEARAFLHAEVQGTYLNLHLLALAPGAVDDGAWLLGQAEAQARAAGLTRMVGPFYRSAIFYGSFVIGEEPYTPQWALDTTSVYICAGLRISYPGVVLVTELREPVTTQPLPEGYTLVDAPCPEEYNAHAFRFVARHNGEETATCTARVYPELIGPVGGPVGQVGFVGTNEAHRGRGLARLLCQHSLARLRNLGAAEALITTGQENYPALKAYEAVGFQRRFMICEWAKDLT